MKNRNAATPPNIADELGGNLGERDAQRAEDRKRGAQRETLGRRALTV